MTFHGAGQKIRIEMVRCGYTLESLSQETEISKTVLRTILTNRVEEISVRNICALARAFDYQASDLIDLLSDRMP